MIVKLFEQVLGEKKTQKPLPFLCVKAVPS